MAKLAKLIQRVISEKFGTWTNYFDDGKIQVGSYSGRPEVRFISNGGKSDPPQYWTVEIIFPPQVPGSKKPRRRSTDWAV